MLLAIPGADVRRRTALMEKVLRFRHAIFVEEKGCNDLQRPDRLEGDPFDDERAVHHLCLRDDEIFATQLRFFARQLGFPKGIGRDGGVALRKSFNRETLETIHEARGCGAPVLAARALDAAA